MQLHPLCWYTLNNVLSHQLLGAITVLLRLKKISSGVYCESSHTGLLEHLQGLYALGEALILLVENKSVGWTKLQGSF